MNASEARVALLAQHERLRNLLEMCTLLALDYRAGEPVPTELDEALGLLRDEFADHNLTETAIIADLLRGPSTWSAQLVERMIEEHVAEHVAFAELMASTSADVAARITELAEQLDAHMAAEERTFLSPVALRDDVIDRRTHPPAAR